MIIGICGFGNSGASAVLDYLRGFEGIGIFEAAEFQILHQADGICDLKYHLTGSRDRIACSAAVKRFIRLQEKGRFAANMRKLIGGKYDEWYKAYIGEIAPLSWQGITSAYDPPDIGRKKNVGFGAKIQAVLNKILYSINSSWHFPPKSTKYFSIMTEEEFDEITKRYMAKLLDLLGCKAELSVIDMLFSVTNPTQGMEFFDDARAIVVVRDPRDNFVTAQLHPEDSRFMPNDSVEKFCEYYRRLMMFAKESENVSVIQYEDLIYKYEETTGRIKKLLGLEGRPPHEFEYYIPTYSKRYTHRENLYRENEAAVKYITEHLSEYLYDFDSAVSPENDAELMKLIEANKSEYKGYNLK